MAALGLVDFELHSTVGPIRPVVRHMALANGRQLFDEQAARAATARRLHSSERWLAPAVVEPPAVELVQAPYPNNNFQEQHRGD